ncbi:MAG: Zn-ribbon domain-containing OB-fold protein, partial [Mycobacteriales bacterium]
AGWPAAAGPLLGALPLLAAPGEVAVLGHGGGRTTGLCLQVRTPVPGAGPLEEVLGIGCDASYTDVVRSRGQLLPGGEPVAMGVPPGSAAFVRGGREMLGLLAGRCVDCGVLAVPPSVHPHCPGCGGEKFTTVGLARRGVVHTFVVNETMPAPFVAPLPLVVVDLEDGARVMLQGCTDPEAWQIGDQVELVLRRYAVERGAPIYGYKVSRVAAREG